MEKKYKSVMQKIKEYASGGKIEAAFQYLKEIPPDHPMNIQELLLKGRIVLLCDENDEFSDLDVKNTFEQVLKIDKNNIEAMLELGHFYSSMWGDQKNSLHYFNKAMQQAHKLYLEALEGIKDILEVLDESQECKTELKEVEAILDKANTLPEKIE